MALRAAIVTGAGSGIGRAAAFSLCRAGFGVVLHGRRRQPLERVAEQMSGQVEVVTGDIAAEATAARLVEAAQARFGGIDAIVNNAGSAELVPIPATTAEVLQAAFATHVFGAAFLIRAAWGALCARPRGVVVNISSMAAVDPLDGFLAYGAAKSALESFTRSIAREGQPHGVEAYSLRLGAVDTPLLRRLFGGGSLPAGAPLPADVVGDTVAACVGGERLRDNGGVIELRAPVPSTPKTG